MRSAEGFGRKEISRFEQKHRSAGNVFSSFSQCGNFNRKDVEPVKHVTTKHACSDSRLQVTIGGGNHSNISSNGSSSTDTFEFMFLQNTQESDLCLNSALKCGLSKRMPFEAGETSGVEASWLPMPPPMSAITGNCVQSQTAVTPGAMATLARRIPPVFA